VSGRDAASTLSSVTGLRTPFCDLVGCELPIVQAPIGSAGTVELVVAVSEAGGLGVLAGSWLELDPLRDAIARIRAATDRPFAVNLVLHWDQRQRVEACLEGGVPVLSFFWGDPSPHVAACHEAGALVLHTVATAAEATRAVALGVDCVVAQGCEAGGHVWGEVSALPLVPAVVDSVAPVPVLAAGGIADGRGLVAALALGASGAWLGTRFVASAEANAHPAWQRAIVEAGERSTTLTTLFDRGWEEAPARVLRTDLVGSWEAAGCPEGERYRDDSPLRDDPSPELRANYAGQSAGLVRDVVPAGELVRRIAREAEATLEALA
jgi:NAD(P)H-dependent flavin oxidoreductase YrpB (nitropropane dioxygenase family)